MTRAEIWVLPPADQATGAYALEPAQIIYPLLLNTLGMTVVALLGGYLADHYYVRLPVIVSTVGYLALASMALASPAVWRDHR